MWFTNLKFYSLTQHLALDSDELERQLADFSFRPCTSQDLTSMGWAAPLGSGELLCHQAAGFYWFNLKTQEKVLPASVINAELAEKVAQIEAETGSAVSGKAKTDLKQEILQRLLPQAFVKNSFIHGFIAPAQKLVVVNASADGKAEVFLAMLRKSLGSLPVVPMCRRSLQADLTLWLKEQQLPTGIELQQEAELKSDDEEGSLIKCKNQDLAAEEIQYHLQAGKLAQKVAIDWQEKLHGVLCEDGSVKRLKFADLIKEQHDDIPKDQQMARLDADFALMAAEVVALAEDLQEIFSLQQEA